ncbi:MAG: PhoU domain-containing protein [Candidatus Methanofastidiosia archaeon]
MEIRKLQLTGGGTYILSLPKRWVEKYGYKKGDGFTLIEQENGLFLTSNFNERRELKCEVEVSEDIGLEIITRYMYGYNSLQIRGNLTRRLRGEIKKTINLLVGYEIIDERENEILIQDLLDPSELSVKSAMKREHFLASTMHRDAIKALCERDSELAKDVVLRDLEVDKLYYLVVRQLRTATMNVSFAERVKVNPLECLDYRIIAKNIEEIGDAAESIAKSILELSEVSEDIVGEIRGFSEVAHLTHRKAIQALYRNDVKEAYKIVKEKGILDEMKRKLDRMIFSQDAKSAILLKNISDNVGTIFQKGIDIAYFVIKPQ